MQLRVTRRTIRRFSIPFPFRWATAWHASIRKSQSRIYAAIHAGFKQGKVANADIPGVMLERNTVLLQKPFTVKKILEVIQQMNVSLRS